MSGPSRWCGHSAGFLGATGNWEPGYLKQTFSREKHSTPKTEWSKTPRALCRQAPGKPEDEWDYTVDSLTWDSSLKAKGRATETAKVSAEGGAGERGRGQGDDEGKAFQGCRTLCSVHSRLERRVSLGRRWVVRLPRCQHTTSLRLALTLDSVRASQKASPPKNKSWMNHLRMPQRRQERLLLAKLENRTCFLRNPRFFPPNTPRGGRSLIFPPRKPEGQFQSGELRCVLTVRIFAAGTP